MPDFETLRGRYALDFTWDVRNHVPPHQDKNGTIDRVRTAQEEQNDDIQKVYNRINMMTFLLDGIPFNVFLNTPIVDWIDHCIYKVAEQGRWPGRVAPADFPDDDDESDNNIVYRRKSPRNDHYRNPDFPNDGLDSNGDPTDKDSELRKLILNVLTEVKRKAGAASTSPKVKLRSLWEQKVTTASDQRIKEVYQEFDKLHQSSHKHRFCLPFITVQNTAAIPLVPTHIMDAFIGLMDGVTHLDVYTKSVKYFPRIRQGIELGKPVNIFEAPETVKITGSGGGGGGTNNRKCDSGLSTCITHDGSSCTADSNGYCTAG